MDNNSTGDQIAELQQHWLFAMPTEGFQAAPITALTQRMLPSASSTNLSTVFGEAVLRDLDLSEEQIDCMRLLQTLPDACLRSPQLSTGLRQYAAQQRAALLQAERAVELLTRHLSTSQLSTLTALALTQQNASLPVVHFATYCRSLRVRLAAVHSSQKQLFAELLALPAVLGRRASLARFDVELGSLLSGQPKSAAELQRWQDWFEAVGETQFPAPVSADQAARLSAAQARTLQPFQLSAAVQRLADRKRLRQFFAKETQHYTVSQLEPDANILCWLFSLPTTNALSERDFAEHVYLYLVRYSSAELLATPAEFLLSAFLSVYLAKLTGLLFGLCVAISLIVHFSESSAEPAYSKAMLGCCRQFLIVSRCAELLGATHRPVYTALARFLALINPGFAGSLEMDWSFSMDDLLRAFSSAAETDSSSNSSLWSYENPAKPWLPRLGVAGREGMDSSLCTALGIVKADRTASFFFRSDAWTHLHWAGLRPDSLEQLAGRVGAALQSGPAEHFLQLDKLAEHFSAVHPKLPVRMLEHALATPNSPLSAKFLLSLLALSSARKPQFFTATAHQHSMSYSTEESKGDEETEAAPANVSTASLATDLVLEYDNEWPSLDS